jgi:putative transposase
VKEIYKTLTVPLKCNNKDYQYMSRLNKLSAEVWNRCVEIDNEFKKETGKSIGLSELEKRTNGMSGLHAAGIHHIVFKYLHSRKSMWNSRKAKHKESRKVELPYRIKKYLPTGWVKINIKVDYEKRKLFLTKRSIDNKRQRPVTCYIKSIPKNIDIVEIELVYKDKYYLAIKYKEIDNTNLIQSGNTASIDLGEIHAITSIDNNGNALIITNRKMRSIIRLKDKKQGKIKSLQSKCKKGSKQYRKYSRAIFKIKFKADRQIRDIIHKQSRYFLNWCIQNQIKTVYYGDVDGITRDSKGKNSKYLNHKLNLWRFGELISRLQNKLTRYNVEMIKVKEYYTSKKCPSCKSLNKPNGRNYTCDCGYTQHRDIVGAINILNDNGGFSVTRYIKKVYLQIA